MTESNEAAKLAYQHLSVLNSPTASPSQISDANKALDALKATLTPATALQLCNLLLAPLFPSSSLSGAATNSSSSLPAIHFAFHILDGHLLQSAQPWTSFPDDIRAAVRTLATTIISELRDTHPALLRQKGVSLLVALALREWPQRWSDFLDQLLQPSTPMIIACQVMQDLSDQVHVFSERIQVARRHELRHALALSLSQTLSYITRAVEISITQPMNANIEVVLECLHSFVHWADLRTLFSAGVPTACITLLKHAETRDPALRVLDTLVSRQFQSSRLPDPDNVSSTKEENAAAMAIALNPHIIYRTSLFPALLRFVSEQRQMLLSTVPFALIPPAGALPVLQTCFEASVSLESIDEDEHSFFVKFITVLAQLGASHFVPTFMYTKKIQAIELTEEEATCAAAFVDLLVVCASSPSLVIRQAVLPFFATISTAVTKHPSGSTAVSNNELLKFIITAFLQCAAIVQVRFISDKQDLLFERFRELDDIDDAQAGSMGGLNPRFSAAASVASRTMPDIVAQFAIQRFMRILELKPAVPATAMNGGHQAAEPASGTFTQTFRQRGFILPDGTQHGWNFGQFSPDSVSEWRACAEGACHFIDAVGFGVLQQQSEHPGLVTAKYQLTEHMRRVFDAVHTSNDALIVSLKPQLFRTFHPLYLVDEGRLSACVERLLSMAISCDGAPNREQSKGQRAKILAALSAILRKLGNTNHKGIAKFWEPLCTYASRAMLGKELETMQKINLMEAALSCVLAIDDVPTQSDGVERVMMPLFEFLSSETVLSVLRTPRTLLDFLQNGEAHQVEEVCQTLLMLEAAMHQIVRPVSKMNHALPLPGSMSRAVAPKAAELSCLLISSLHQIHGVPGAQLGRSDQDMISIVQPTSREVSYVLNIDAAENLRKGIGELVEHGGLAATTGNVNTVVDETGVKPSPGEIKSAEVLRANGVPPPDDRHIRLRERLRNLRRAGYEIMRAAIYSGAAESDVHVRALVSAAFSTTHPKALEPLHALSLLSRVAAPLVQFSVCEAGGSYMQASGELGLAAFLQYIRDMIIGAQRGTELFSDTRVQDLTREASRNMIGRLAADALAAMFPRIEAVNPGEKESEKAKEDGVKEKAPFLPLPLRTPSTSESVISLWATICSSVNDQGAARVALNSLAHAVDLAGSSAEEFSLFSPLSDAALKVAVVFRGGTASSDEGAGQAAVSALVAIIRKWPREFGVRVIELAGAQQQERKDEVSQWVGECVNGLAADSQASASRVKKHRVLVRTLAERIGQLQGVDPNAQSTVHALPEKLSAIVGANKMAKNKNLGRRRQDQEDLELTDSALDSLFGEGAPL